VTEAVEADLTVVVVTEAMTAVPGAVVTITQAPLAVVAPDPVPHVEVAQRGQVPLVQAVVGVPLVVEASTRDRAARRALATHRRALAILRVVTSLEEIRIQDSLEEISMAMLPRATSMELPRRVATHSEATWAVLMQQPQAMATSPSHLPVARLSL